MWITEFLARRHMDFIELPHFGHNGQGEFLSISTKLELFGIGLLLFARTEAR